MFEYEFVQQRNEDLRRQAGNHRLVREALAAHGDRRPTVLRRLGLSSVRVARPRPARLGEC